MAGTIGDTVGDTAFSKDYFYVCIQSFNGVTQYSNIASRSNGTAGNAGRFWNTAATGANLGNVRVGWTVFGPNISGYATITQINYAGVNEWEFITDQIDADLRSGTGYTFSGYPEIWQRSNATNNL